MILQVWSTAICEESPCQRVMIIIQIQVYSSAVPGEGSMAAQNGIANLCLRTTPLVSHEGLLNFENHDLKLAPNLAALPHKPDGTARLPQHLCLFGPLDDAGVPERRFGSQ